MSHWIDELPIMGSSFGQHDAALELERERAAASLPGQGLTQVQWLSQLNDTLQAENARLMQETLHQRDALTQTNHQLRMRVEELEWSKRDYEQESKARQKLLEATGGMVPEFQRQGNFTVCLLIDPLSERVYTGVACCGRDDTFNLEIGKAISLGRAMAQRADYFADNAFNA